MIDVRTNDLLFDTHLTKQYKCLLSYCSQWFLLVGVMVSYAVCSDIVRNNTGTVTGAMNFFRQTGAFFLALIFGKIADITHNFQLSFL